MKHIKTWFVIVLSFGVLTGCSPRGDQELEELKSEIRMEKEAADKNKQSVQAFFNALEREDVDELVSLFAEDARHINPYASGLFPTGANGSDEIRQYWTPVFPNFDGMQFLIEEMHAMEDPHMIYVKYKGKIRLKNDAGFYENDYYSTFRFDTSGLITEYVELFNPIVAARAFGLIDKIE